jgi:TolA protein
VPKNPEKTEVNTPEPKKEPPKADPPKKNEAPKKPPLKTPDPPKKPPAAPKPQKDSLAAALAELSREAGRSAPRGNRAPSGQTRAGGRDQAEAGGQANGDASGPSPGGDGGDGYGALGAYQDSIISRVRPNWSLPARADRRSYTAVVNIKIDRDGAILEARIIRSSGNGFFDASVMQAVAATKNLEPPPLPDYSDINISFTPESLGRQ